MGVSAVIIEDKKYPKRNSLEKDAIQLLEDPKEFAIKVNRAKDVCISSDFMIFYTYRKLHSRTRPRRCHSTRQYLFRF